MGWPLHTRWWGERGLTRLAHKMYPSGARWVACSRTIPSPWIPFISNDHSGEWCLTFLPRYMKTDLSESVAVQWWVHMSTLQVQHGLALTCKARGGGHLAIKLYPSEPRWVTCSLTIHSPCIPFKSNQLLSSWCCLTDSGSKVHTQQRKHQQDKSDHFGRT
jgi:hypothetical protein